MPATEKIAAGNLAVVKNFRRVIETRDLSLMHKELYNFLIFNCGFIAHYNIHGFRDTYADPKEFADIFIRHFDRDHCYFNSGYACHNVPYKDTGYTKNEIKEEFFRIVDSHKDSISKWVDDFERKRRYAAFQVLNKEIEQEKNLSESYRESVGVKIKKNSKDNSVMGSQFTLF